MGRFMIVLVTAIASVCSAARGQELLCGVAVQDITPPTGYRMSGYFHERLATGTHDPLHVRAVVFNQGETAIALAVVDLSNVPQDLATEARQAASKRSGIPASNIAVMATHTHSGPLYRGLLRDRFHAAAVAAHGHDPHETLDYPRLLVEKVAQAVQEASEAARPAVLKAGAAQEYDLSFNRRFHMADGSVRTWGGKQDPNVLRPAGPTDPQVSLIMIQDREGRPMALLYNYALHLDTVGGTQYSADFPYYVERELRAQYGPSFIAVFLQGACGDINHIDTSTALPQKGHEEAERIGLGLAATIKPVLSKLTAVDAKLAAANRVLEVPVRQYDAKAEARAGEYLNSQPPFSLDLVNACVILSLSQRGRPSTLPLEVQAFALAENLALVTLPGEVFVDLGLAVKEHSPFAHTLVAELANAAPHYVPTRQAFSEGGYEVTNSLIQPGGGEMLTEAAIELLKRLRN